MRITQALGNTLLVVAGLALWAAGAPAQESPERSPRPSIRVTAEATIAARPDQAQVDVGVVAQAQTAQMAAAQNSRQLDAVLAALRKALGAAADVRTAGYSLQPIYRREGGAATITGYTATNTIQVRTDDLGAVGRVIDTAMQAGANQIARLQFTLKDERAAQAEALRQAAVKARAQAEAVAGALGLKIVRVLSAVEGGPEVRPVVRAMAMQPEALGAPTPVEPGTIEVRATVTLVVEVAP